MPELRIADAARLTETNPSTLRLWEQHGLLNPTRTSSGQRVYSDEDVRVIRTIHRLRKVDGLNMSAIRRVLANEGMSSASSPEVRSARHKPANAAHPPAPTEPIYLGSQFRATRLRREMSLQEAADASGLPVSFISTFERTSKGATVASLQRLAACYGTTITDLSSISNEKPGQGIEIIRAGKERITPQFGDNIKILQLADRLHSLDCQKWVLEPGAQSEGAYSHIGEEFIHVLQGEFHIAIDNGRITKLLSGDSISFDSRRPHSWQAAGTETTVLLWVNTPKSF